MKVEQVYKVPECQQPLVTALFHAVNRNPRMKGVYLEYLNMWKASGGELFNQFVDAAGGINTAVGELWVPNQEPSKTPKWD